MKKRKNKEKGQATAEFVISLIGILAVISGLLMMIDLGVSKTANVLDARENAEIYALNEIISSPGIPIRYWDSGEDGFLYTEDDRAVISTTEDPNIFISELNTAELSLSSGFSFSYVENNFVPEMSTEKVFLPAANLTSANVTRTVELDGAAQALFFNTPSLSLRDTIYMPVIE
ncbi:MAG TPA: hypothetical protein P5105_01520 [Victivallales bacterium]|nr:hypothetical protein [Victivallales bacterium]